VAAFENSYRPFPEVILFEAEVKIVKSSKFCSTMSGNRLIVTHTNIATHRHIDCFSSLPLNFLLNLPLSLLQRLMMRIESEVVVSHLRDSMMRDLVMLGDPLAWTSERKQHVHYRRENFV
jgi:hypothetical protein